MNILSEPLEMLGLVSTAALPDATNLLLHLL